MRIDGNTVAADADAGPVQVRERLAVGSLERLLDVGAASVSIKRQLVGERAVHVAIGGLGELADLPGTGFGHLGGRSVRRPAGKRGPSPRSRAADPPDAP